MNHQDNKEFEEKKTWTTLINNIVYRKGFIDVILQLGINEIDIMVVSNMNLDIITKWINKEQLLTENQCIGLAVLCTKELRYLLWYDILEKQPELTQRLEYFRPF